MRRFRAVAMLAFFLILTSVSFADDAGVRSRESFNANWRFARFGPMADRLDQARAWGRAVEYRGLGLE